MWFMTDNEKQINHKFLTFADLKWLIFLLLLINSRVKKVFDQKCEFNKIEILFLNLSHVGQNWGHPKIFHLFFFH